MKNRNLGFPYSKTEDRVIVTRKSGTVHFLTDVALAKALGRTPGAIRQRRYILTSA